MIPIDLSTVWVILKAISSGLDALNRVGRDDITQEELDQRDAIRHELVNIANSLGTPPDAS